MGKKLEEFLGTKLFEIGLDWWETKQEEFNNLPFVSKENQTISYHGEVEEWDINGKSRTTFIDVNFDFLMYAKHSEKHYEELDSALRLTNYGALDEMQFRIVPGLDSVMQKILEAIDKDASLMAPSYDFKVFIDRTLALINDELDENSGIVDSDDYRKLMERFYNEIEAEILSKYKYKYDASQSSSPPNYEKFPLKLNIEQLSALATYLSSVSELTKSQRVDLFAHFSNVFEIWDKKKHKSVELKQIHSAFRKIKMKKHEGAGLKEILHRTHEIIDAINSSKSNDFLDIK